LSEEQRTGWIVGATFAALLALSGALMAALNHSIHVADAFTRKDEREMVARYLDTRVRTVIIGQTGQLVWDDSMRHAVLGNDITWMDRELGMFPWTNQGAAETMLVDHDGTLVRAWKEGVPRRTIPMRRRAGRWKPLWPRPAAMRGSMARWRASPGLVTRCGQKIGAARHSRAGRRRWCGKTAGPCC
jgi:hypothetical protein